jgi:hypothetical protein
MAETRVVNLEVKDNTKSLKAQLKEAQMEVQALADKYGATSVQAKEAAKRAADLKDRIGDAKALTDAYNPDAKFKAFGAALTGVAGGFSAVTGAMGLLGTESEDVQKAMLRVQSAMAITSGLNALGEARDSFKNVGAQVKDLAVKLGILKVVKDTDTASTTANAAAQGANVAATEAQVAANGQAAASYKAVGVSGKTAFNGIKGAMAATGIGALVVALGLIVAYWDDIKAAVSGVSKEQNNLVEQDKKRAELAEKSVQSFDLEAKALKLAGKSEKEINLLRLDRLKKAVLAQEQYIADMEVRKKMELEGEKRNLGILKNVARAGIELGTYTLRLLALPIDAATTAVNSLSEALGFGTVTTFNINKEISKFNESAAEGLAKLIFNPDKVKAEGDKTIDEAKTKLDQFKGQVLDAELALQEIDKNAAETRKKNAESAADALLKQQEEEAAAKRKLREEELKLIKDDQQREIEQNKFKYDILIEDLKKGKKELNDTDRALIATYEAQRLKDEEAINAKYLKIQQDHDAKVLADMKAADAAELAAFFEGEKIKVDAMQAGFDKQKAIRELAYKQEVADLAAKLDEGKITQEQYDIANVNATKKLNADIQALRQEDLSAERAKMEQKQAIQQQGMDVALQGVDLLKQVFGKSKAVQKGAVLVESAIGIAKMIQANNIANIGALATPQAIATSGAAAAPVIAMNNISTGIGIAANIAATAKALKEIGAGGSVNAPSSTGGSAGGGGGGGTSTMQAPNFNVVGNNGINQLAQLQQQPVKAYVVGAEVTTQQALDRNRISTGQL